MKKFEFTENAIQQNELSKIQGGTTTTEVVIVGRQQCEECVVAENEYIGKVREGDPDFISYIPCDKVQ